MKVSAHEKYFPMGVRVFLPVHICPARFFGGFFFFLIRTGCMEVFGTLCEII